MKNATLNQIDLAAENARVTLARVGNHLFFKGNDRLFKRKHAQSRQRKHEVLEQIKEDYTNKANVQFGDKVIDITTDSNASVMAA